MRKGVAYLFRYREVSLTANGRYLDALAEVDDPTDAIQTFGRITTRKQVAPKRTVKAFNPVAREDHQLFQVLLNGQHCVRGFSHPDIRHKLRTLRFSKRSPTRSAKVSRLPSLSCSLFDRQGPPFSALARHSIRTHRHGRPTPRNSIPAGLYTKWLPDGYFSKKRRTNT